MELSNLPLVLHRLPLLPVRYSMFYKVQKLSGMVGGEKMYQLMQNHIRNARSRRLNYTAVQRNTAFLQTARTPAAYNVRR